MLMTEQLAKALRDAWDSGWKHSGEGFNNECGASSERVKALRDAWVDENLSEYLTAHEAEKAAPAPAAPVAVPLTDEQINDLIPSPYLGDVYMGYSRTDLCRLARAIERAHSIGVKLEGGEA